MKRMLSNNNIATISRRRNVSSYANSASASAVVLLLLSSLFSLGIFQITITTTNAFTTTSRNRAVGFPTLSSHHRNKKLYARSGGVSNNEDDCDEIILLSKIKTSSSESNKLSLSKTIIGETNKEKNNFSTRRSALLSTAKLASAALFTLSINPSFAANAADDNDGDVSTTTSVATTTTTPITASWKAVDGLNTQDDNTNFISFESSAYKAMINDESRTPLFYKTIEERLSQMDSESNKIVVDLGTGPYAIFAMKAAEYGAKKVYAIEANAKAAQMARDIVKEKGYDDIITIIEGYSTDIELPNNDKADLIIAEIIGSIVSEEGCVTTILDASKRFAKNPTDKKTWIPQRVQTLGCPASYTLHNLFGPPSFDWSKLNGEPVRFNCRDEGLQLLCNIPQLIEDIDFSNIQKYNSNNKKQLTFQVDENLIEDNKSKLIIELQENKLRENEALKVAIQTANSFSGIAFWPRLILNDDGNESYTINSRSYPNGEHQKSHWQTVLPIMNDIPIIVNGSTKISIDININIGDLNNINKSASPTYKIDGNVITTSTSTSASMPASA
jgi:hypothetical protein